MKQAFPVYAVIDHSGPDLWSNWRKIGSASSKEEADKMTGGHTSFGDGCWIEHKRRVNDTH